MKKVTVLTLDRHLEATLSALRALGVVHPEAVVAPQGEPLEAARQAHQTLQRVVTVLRAHAAERAHAGQRRRPAAPAAPAAREQAASKPAGDRESTDALADRLHQQQQTHKDLSERRQLVAREITATEPLGDIEPDVLRALERRGLPVRWFRHPGREIGAAPDGALRHILQADRDQVMYALIGAGDPPAGDQPLALPERSLRAMREEAAELDRRLAECDAALDAAAMALPRLNAALAQRAEAVRMAEARAGMGSRDSIRYLRGYSPVETLDALRQAARQQGWSLLVEDPLPADVVPTLIRHPGWVRPIRAVLHLMGILPGYREIDISAAFLLFFSLFFAIIVGDAGYGAIFLGLTLLARRRWGRQAPPEPFRLMIVLSLCTIAWGLLSGNLFGTSFFPTLIPWLEGADGGPHQQNLMLLCFVIGAVHLTVAHAWNAITILNSPQALAQAGWIALTWFMFLMARSLILGAAFPDWSYALLAGGLLLVVLFMTPRRLLKTEWVSHAMLPLTVINNFVDVVSYVRLFAVGFASLAVAQAFNQMAANAGGSGWLGGLATALILFGGHALNIVLCLLSVMVHGIRLNTLEFSGHIGMQWTGFAYRPLAAEAATQVPGAATGKETD